MKQRKGFISIGILALVGILSVVTFVFGGSVYTALASIPVSCDGARYNPNCICGDGYHKIYVENWGGYACENDDLAINPDSESFAEDAVSFAINEISSMYPDCDTKDCSMGIVVATIGWLDTQRNAFVECRDSTSGNIWWNALIDVEDGGVVKSECNNFYEKPAGENTAYLKFDGIGYANDGILIKCWFATDCRYSGIATASMTYKIPDAFGTLASLQPVTISADTCTATPSGNSVTIDCTKNCGAGGGGVVSYKAILDRPECKAIGPDGNTVIYHTGNSACEEPPGVMWYCMNDGLFHRDPDTRQCSSSFPVSISAENKA